MFGQSSPDAQKSLVSANQNKSMQEDNMDLMLQDFNNQSRSQADGDPSFVNKEGETESAAEELDPNQIDLENLNESELMNMMQQKPDENDDDDFIDVDNPEDLARKGLRRI